MATIAITGASGFIGSALSRALSARGDRVLPLVRPGSKAKTQGVHWDPDAGELDETGLEGVDAVVHLAGEGVANGRWTEAQKARIKDSRVRGTSLLAQALARRTRKPSVFVSASAIGIYGDRGDEQIDESSASGHDFLSEVGRAWEASAMPALHAGIRVVHPRFGLVLHPEGGVLARLLLPFRLGVGGKLGSGEQYMSWIAREDAVRALLHLLDHRTLQGPVNVTAPHPVTNAEFTRALGRALGRPTVMTVPAFAARLAFGEMADAALLSGARVMPRKLLDSGFQFEHSELEPLLRALVG